MGCIPDFRFAVADIQIYRLITDTFKKDPVISTSFYCRGKIAAAVGFAITTG